MKSSALTPLLLATACAHSLPHLSISKRDAHSGGATNHFRRAVTSPHQLRRRQGSLGTNIFNGLVYGQAVYFANVTVGTPPQLQTLIVDTGSSDTYFDASNATTCQLPTSNPEACVGGTFDRSASSTYNQLDASPAFNTTYGDGTTAIGPYGEDVIGINDLLISPVQFGVAEEISSGTQSYSTGLMGLGYSYIEAVQRQRTLYQNFPEVLKDAGVINSRLYSVYLNDDSASYGSVLFGGIDLTKFEGDMATVNFLPYFGYDQSGSPATIDLVIQFITTITAASVTADGQTTRIWSGGAPGADAYTDSHSLPVLLDTGSTAFSVPTNFYRAISQALFGETIPTSSGLSCAQARSGDYLSLTFDDKITIKVDISEFVAPIVDPITLEPIPFDADNDACAFLIQPDESPSETGTNFWIAGDAVMRSMYVVFDLDNGQASIAQAAFNVTSDPDVVTVAAGPTGVAEAVSGLQTAPPNTLTIGPEITVATSAFSVSTANTAVGTETVVVGAGGANGANGANPTAETSTGAAHAVVVPGADWSGVWVSCVSLVFVALGAGLVL